MQQDGDAADDNNNKLKEAESMHEVLYLITNYILSIFLRTVQ